MHLEDRIFNVKSEQEFNDLALEIFDFQYNNVAVYRNYVDQLGHSTPKQIEEIPFLPISFFKSHRVSLSEENELLFRSSGTGGIRSQHYVRKASLYERSFNSTYKQLIGNPEKQVILALLPNYIEQGESSLVYMVDHLIKGTNNELSGFFLENHDELLHKYELALKQNKEVVLFGVSYALLDLIDKHPSLSEAIVIETGGMKGRRKELTKRELHDELQKGLKCQRIWSEYGMTELLSQAYSRGGETFECGTTMKVLIRETNDPFQYAPKGKTGGINVIDLCNLYSCSFIETQDLGQKSNSGFSVLGRFDQAELRGCNLMVQ
jgi:hypothetical protein